MHSFAIFVLVQLNVGDYVTKKDSSMRQPSSGIELVFMPKFPSANAMRPLLHLRLRQDLSLTDWPPVSVF